MKRLRSVYPALVLLLALLGGGFGLPIADALLFHGNPNGQPTVASNLTDEGSARAHVQVCSLEKSTVPKKALPGLPGVVVLRELAVQTAPSVHTDQPPTRHTPDTYQSRAPPSA